LYRGINDFKKGYQPRTKIVEDEKDDLLTDYHSTFARWRKHFSELFSLHWVINVRWTEIRVRTAEPLVPEPSASEFEMAVEYLKGKHLSDMFPIRKGLKNEILYHHCFPSLL